MLRIIVLIGAVAVLSVGAAATALGQGAMTPALKGTVGPSYTISLTKGGKPVKSLKAGTYTITVSDKSSMHNFTIERESPKPKIEKHITSTAFVGTKTVKMNLKKGSWKFYCSVHESTMHGTFKVT
jgi:plastocyanin